MGGNESSTAIQHGHSTMSSSNLDNTPYRNTATGKERNLNNADHFYVFKENVMDANKNVYTGRMYNGSRHGKGQMQYANGSEYDGDWKNNMRHGSGVFINEKGEKYTGEWKKDNMHGQGTLENPDLTEFKGNWVNGLKHGTGILISTGNKKWSQTWAEGRLLDRKKIKDIWEMSEGDNADFGEDYNPGHRQNFSSHNKSVTDRSKDSRQGDQKKNNKNNFGPETMSLENFRCNLPNKLGCDFESGDKKVVDWTKDDVYNFLYKQDLKFAAKQCFENEIGGKNLIKMTESDWSKFGLSKGKLITLRDALEKLKKLSKREVREKLNKRFGRNSKMNYDKKFMNNDSNLNPEREKTPKDVIQYKKLNGKLSDANKISNFVNQKPSYGNHFIRKADEKKLNVPKHSRNNPRSKSPNKDNFINMIRSEEPTFQNRYFINHGEVIYEKSEEEIGSCYSDAFPKTIVSDELDNKTNKHTRASYKSRSNKKLKNENVLKKNQSLISVQKLKSINPSTLKRTRTVSSDFERESNRDKIKRQFSHNVLLFDEYKREFEQKNELKKQSLLRQKSDLSPKKSKEKVANQRYGSQELGDFKFPGNLQIDITKDGGSASINFSDPVFKFPSPVRDEENTIKVKNVGNTNEVNNLRQSSCKISDGKDKQREGKLRPEDLESPDSKKRKKNQTAIEVKHNKNIDIIASPMMNRKKYSGDVKRVDYGNFDLEHDYRSDMCDADVWSNCANIGSSSRSLSQDISELEKKVNQQSRLPQEIISSSSSSDSDVSKVSESQMNQIKIAEKDFEVKQLLGETELGKTSHGIYCGLDVSIKEIPFLRSKYSSQKSRLYKKAILYSEIRHPNIVQFMGISIRKKEAAQDSYCVITEYMNNFSLYHHIHHLKQKYSEKYLVSMLEDITLGMTYLHENDVLHYSLKSTNILTEENNGMQNFKVCDFGLRDFTRKNKTTKKIPNPFCDNIPMGDKSGNEYWLSREALNNKKSYNSKDDIYSFGILLWELISGEIPFKNLNPKEFLKEVNSDEDTLRPQDGKAPPKQLNLMRKCLDKNPKVRPEFKHLLQEIQNQKKELNNNKHIIQELHNFFGPAICGNGKNISSKKNF